MSLKRQVPRAARKKPVEPWRLTATEARVAGLVASGQSNRQAAAQLGLAPEAIERHLADACRKLGVRSRTELALLMGADARNQGGVMP